MVSKGLDANDARSERKE